MARKIPKPPPITPVGAELTIDFVHQEKSNWCWCACTKMVLQHFAQPEVEKCQIANRAFGRKDCCAGEECNFRLPLKDAPNSIVRLFSDYGIKVDVLGDMLTFAQVSEEIHNDRPVEASLQWTGGGHHVVIIYGWRSLAGANKLLVHDPWRGASVVEYQRLAEAYGDGRWTTSLSNFRKDK